MYPLIIILIFLLIPCAGSASPPILSAQFTDRGYIRVTLKDGTVMDVPGNRANADRRALQKWVAQGNTIAPADPAPEPTRLEKIRRDPSYPSAHEFMEAQIHCRYDLDCSALDALSSRIKRLENQYP